MKCRGVFYLATVALATLALGTFAQAKTKVQGNIVPQNVGPVCGDNGVNPCYTLPADKFGKYQAKESNAAGGGGLVLALKLKGLSCETVGMGSPANQCEDTNNVLEINTDFSGLETKVGVLYDVSKGKAAFQAGGKNKVSSAQIFGSLVGAVQGQSLGIGILRVRGPGSNPADCLNAPLLGMQGCTDGEKYGIGGVHVNDEPGTAPPPCAGDGDCSVTQVCTAGACTTETCTMDSDCHSFTGMGSDVACNEVSGQCCLPNLDTDPDCDID